MSYQPIDFSKIDWLYVLPTFGIDERYLVDERGPCPICGGNTRFRFENLANRGNWVCNCGHGLALDLIRAVNPGLELAQIMERIRESVGQVSDRTMLQPLIDKFSPEQVAKNKDKIDRALRWVKPIGNGPVAKYISYRVPGFDMKHLGSGILYNPSMYYFKKVEGVTYEEKYPVMLAKMVDRHGELVNVHRTYLSVDGRKAPVPDAKMMMKGLRKLEGAAARVCEVSGCRTLFVTEGVETALAVARAYKYTTNVWALYSAGNLKAADIPETEFDEVVIFGDNDPVDLEILERQGKTIRVGQEAAFSLCERLNKSGFKASVKIPPVEGTDWCDVWVEFYRQKQIEHKRSEGALQANQVGVQRPVHQKVPPQLASSIGRGCREGQRQLAR